MASIMRLGIRRGFADLPRRLNESINRDLTPALTVPSVQLLRLRRHAPEGGLPLVPEPHLGVNPIEPAPTAGDLRAWLQAVEYGQGGASFSPATARNIRVAVETLSRFRHAHETDDLAFLEKYADALGQRWQESTGGSPNTRSVYVSRVRRGVLEFLSERVGSSGQPQLPLGLPAHERRPMAKADVDAREARRVERRLPESRPPPEGDTDVRRLRFDLAPGRSVEVGVPGELGAGERELVLAMIRAFLGG
jgi:hypothetical protein